MKILLINDYGTPTGGAELMMLALRKGLQQRGHDARLFTSSVRPLEVESQADYECFGTASSFRTLLQAGNVFAVRKLQQVIAEFQPDIIHVRIFLTQLSPLILPLLKNRPSIYHVAWYRPICPIGTKMLPDGSDCQNSVGIACLQHHCLPIHDWLPLMLQMQLWQRWRDAFNLVVANSEAVKHRLIQSGIEPVEVVWNGIPIRPARPALDSPPTAVFAGRLVWEKGVDLLLQAFAKVIAQIPDARLLLAGDGKELDALTVLVAQLGLEKNVFLLGHLSRTEMEEKFASSWVQVVPSRWAEPFGIVAAEAMMRGTAVIASNAGGLSEIVCHGKTGFLVPPNNVEALAKALVDILENREFAEKLGAAGRELALRNFSETSFVDKFIQIYSNI
ncbi:MAG: glycosyltransferase family 4 protein [Calothrix sp. SM1_7_51]|nr:glycosyltransferase family 4 protein [Calothrix sp. SM1_7_51]